MFLVNFFSFTFRTVIRLILVLKYRIGIQHSPSIPPLNRKVDVPELCEENKIEMNGIPKNVEVTFTLQHSGRVVRTLEAGKINFLTYDQFISFLLCSKNSECSRTLISLTKGVVKKFDMSKIIFSEIIHCFSF